MTKEAEDDDLFVEACKIARAEGRASNTFLQGALGIGTGRARKLLARMEAAGVISPADALGARTVFTVAGQSPKEDTTRAALDKAFQEAAADPRHAETLRAAADLRDREAAKRNQKGEMRMDDVTDDEDKGEGEGKTHNAQAPGSNMVHGEELRQAIEVIERIRGDKKDLAEREREKFAEMKGRGYDTAAIKYLLKRRTVRPDTQAEFEAVTEVYMAALGMLNEPPLFRAVAGMGADPAVRESVIMALKMVVPMGGEITIREGTGPRVRLSRDKDGVRVEEVVDLEELDGKKPKKGDDPGAATKPPVPEATDDQAFILGRTARKDNVPIVQNPFPFGDARRRHWDEGWREEDGGDGFGGDE
jgi:uncharacterized protein (UPF0335 family)